MLRRRRLPLPPMEFAHRVGCPPTDNTMEQYVAIGARMHDQIVGALPEGWGFEGRRVLDFGCGAGRLLRHFSDEAAVAEFFGSDTDPEMVAWVGDHLCPPITGAQVNGEAPPLDFPDSHFDLVLATSVFTHITDQWSAWLLEMHRLLKPDGLMIATFLGRGTSAHLLGEPWDGRRVGMNPLGFTGGAPFVLHSNWWLRAHWGRVFDFLSLRPEGFAAQGGPQPSGHAWAVLRPKADPARTIDELERDEPGERRYVEARRHHLRQLAAEGMRVREKHRAQLDGLRAVKQAPASVQPTPTAPTPGEDGSRAWLTPILVDYASRDGSTLMMRLLSSSGQIAVERQYPYERKYFAYLVRWAGLLDRTDWPEEQWSQFELGSLTQAQRQAMVGPPPWLPRAAFKPAPGDDPISKECFRFAWAEFSDRAARASIGGDRGEPDGVAYYAEKHLNTWMVDLDELPPLRVIVLLRDPRDAYASIAAFNAKRTGGAPLIGLKPDETVESWRERFLAHQAERLRWIASLGDRPDRPVFRYEDMVRDLHGQARRLEETLSVELDPDAVLADRKLRAQHATSSSPESSIDRWKQELSEEEIALFRRELGDELEALGFSV